MAGEEGVRGDPLRQSRSAALHSARRPAVRERRHPYRARGQQDPQGHRRQEQGARRLRRAVCAGVGLPRHADRSADRKDVRQGHPRRRDAAAGPGVRERADRAAKGAVPAARRARRLGPSVHDDGVSQRSRRDPHARRDSRQGLHLSRAQAGELVLRLPVGAGRSRSRIRGPHRYRDRRRLRSRFSRPGQARAGIRPREAARRSGARRHLDDDALDDPGQSGAGRAPGSRLFAGGDRSRQLHPGERAGRRLPCALRHRKKGAGWPLRAQVGRPIARGHSFSPPVLRSRIAGSARRIRDPGAGDRDRAQFAGVRRR